LVSNAKLEGDLLVSKFAFSNGSTCGRYAVGSVHALTFEDAGEGEGKTPLGMFVSERCSDGDMVVGRIVEQSKSLR
jgi:hypothetical protein